jgi:butyryl-CoA dehydrogenase
MHFDLTEEQELIFKAASEICEKEIAPRAEEVDARGEFPWENIKLLSEADMVGIAFPETYGGLGAGFMLWSMIGEELSRACTTTGAIFGAHMLCAYPIFLFGNEEQKKKYLPDLCKGKKIGAFALTESNAGSDAGNVQTTAVRDGNHYILNGTKLFITNAGAAETYVIIASSDKNKGARGLSAFIVEKGMKGFEIGKNEKKMAFFALPNRELIFTDCRVPKENILMQECRGFRVAMQTLDVGRIGMACGAVGLARAAYDEALKYSKVRVQFGKPISSFQAIQFKLADMATQIEAAKLLVYKAAYMKDQNQKFEKLASMAKLYASELCSRAVSEAVQIHGGYGYIKEYKVERLYRESKLFEIVEGTSEIQRAVIANYVLKES